MFYDANIMGDAFKVKRMTPEDVHSCHFFCHAFVDNIWRRNMESPFLEINFLSLKAQFISIPNHLCEPTEPQEILKQFTTLYTQEKF